MNVEITSVLEMLEKKNSYLLEFHKINNDELSRLHKGHTNNLENFYYSREILLNAIDRIDHELSFKKSKKTLKTSKKEKDKFVELIKFKQDMVLSILDQDITIISLVEELQNKKLSIAA